MFVGHTLQCDCRITEETDRYHRRTSRCQLWTFKCEHILVLVCLLRSEFACIFTFEHRALFSPYYMMTSTLENTVLVAQCYCLFAMDHRLGGLIPQRVIECVFVIISSAGPREACRSSAHAVWLISCCIPPRYCISEPTVERKLVSAKVFLRLGHHLENSSAITSGFSKRETISGSGGK